MSQALSDAQLQRVAAAYQEHKSERGVAKALGLSKSGARHQIHRAAEKGLLGFKPVLPGFEIKTTAVQRDGDGNTEKEWIKQHKAAGGPFAMPEGQILKEGSYFVDGEQRVRHAWIKTKGDAVTPALVESLKAQFAGFKGRARPVPAPRFFDRDLLNVYPIADQHNGLLAWGRETGEAYDLRIGSERLLSSAATLIAQSPRSRCGLILNLGDWQHADDQSNTTRESHNQLDVDGRWYKVLTVGVRLMMDVINLGLARHQTVIVVNLPGNHDPHASKALTIALAAFYARDKRVRIIDDAGEFFFYRFGANLIGATHGHRMKPEKMAQTMAVDRPQDWGSTLYRWFLFGHIHHETVKEVMGVRVESFQTLVAKDAWHHASGYRAGQSLQSVTLHKTRGEISRHRVNIPPPSMR